MSIPAALIKNHTEYREKIRGDPETPDRPDCTPVGHSGYRYEWCRRGNHAFLCAYGVPAEYIKDCGDPHCRQV